MENEMETGVILRFKELNLDYYILETLLTTTHTHYANKV